MEHPAPGRAATACRRLGIAGVLAFVLLVPTPSRAQHDPWSTLERGPSGGLLASYQGMDCVSIRASRSIVWRLLVAPEYSAALFFADSPDLKPRGGRYKKGSTAETGDVLSLEATTSKGPRHLELGVLAAVPPHLLSFLVRSDDADLLDKGVEQLSFTFGLETVPDGVTDLYLASHYDSDSPFTALFSQVAAHHQHDRRLAILEMTRLLAEEAARMKDPPLPEVALSTPPPAIARTPRPRT